MVQKKTVEKTNILITGPPGIGKTTVIRKLAEELKGATGFFTQEIRERGVRKGFKLQGLDGSSGILSHVNIRKGPRVGRYGVDLKGFEGFLASLDLLRSPSPVVVIDEIGKMECFSGKFIDLTRELLSSEKVVVAAISIKGSGFIEEVRSRCDCLLKEVTRSNRDLLGEELARKVQSLLSDT